MRAGPIGETNALVEVPQQTEQTGPLKVHRLDDALVDQIAAGEVIERPANVVKELLDNAVDAGATQIQVEVDGGGIGRIRVTDNGEGMSHADALLAVQRHATSKLKRFDDLLDLGTMGFRGEALPSIASVSKFTLTSRRPKDLSATVLHIEGGGPAAVSEKGAAPGTTIEVRDLFFNVPARRKFLKANATENAHIADICQRVALAHPDKRIVLVRDGRRAREFLPTTDRLERVQQVLGGYQLQEVTGGLDRIHLFAALGRPEDARSGATGLHIFVNLRPVKDRALARAVALAYGNLLAPGRYPVGALFVDVPPADVDVNVHPQKSEVRFAHSARVLDALTRVLGKALGAPMMASGRRTAPTRTHVKDVSARYAVGPLPVPEQADDGADPWGLSGELSSDAEEQNPSDRSGEAKTAALTAELARPVGEATSKPAAQPSNKPHASAPRLDKGAFTREGTTREATPAAHVDSAAAPVARNQRGEGSTSVDSAATKGNPPSRFFGLIRDRMLLVDDGHALAVWDPHAVDECVRLTCLVVAFEAGDVPRHALLFPERVVCAPTHLARVATHESLLSRLGLDCAVIGQDTVAVRTVPTELRSLGAERLLSALLDALPDVPETDEASLVAIARHAFEPLACESALPKGTALTAEEGVALIDRFFALSAPTLGRHGKLALHEVAHATLEDKLARR